MRRRILERARAAIGVEFGAYRPAIMARRVQHRALSLGCDSLEDYLRRLDSEPAELPRLIDALLIKTTELFRELPTFDRLRQELPRLVEQRAVEGNAQLRAWVAGCSTGEEAYSLACVLLSTVEALEHPLSVRVFASDANPRAIEQARRGVVARRSEQAPIPPWAERWFEPSAEGLVVAASIRAVTTFSLHDLLDEHQPVPQNAIVASFDVVSCRNVLIYLEEPHRRRVLDRLASAVEPHGMLLLGDAESTPPEEAGLRRPYADAPLYQRAS